MMIFREETVMASQTAENFMSALQEAERTGDVNALVKMFTDDAEITNIALKQPFKGRDGAYEFWNDYLKVFDRIASEFTHVTEGGETAVLEWRAEGALRHGHPIHYCGVSIIEMSDGRVRRFRSYYDSAQFIHPVSHAA
jgi:ketosteroid isomerase-like protein